MIKTPDKQLKLKRINVNGHYKTQIIEEGKRKRTIKYSKSLDNSYKNYQEKQQKKPSKTAKMAPEGRSSPPQRGHPAEMPKERAKNRHFSTLNNFQERHEYRIIVGINEIKKDEFEQYSYVYSDYSYITDKKELKEAIYAQWSGRYNVNIHDMRILGIYNSYTGKRV